MTRKVMTRKGKKNPKLVYPGLRYTHKKRLFEYENQFRLKKKTQKNFWEQFQKYFEKFFFVAIKKMLFTHFPYMEIV